MCTLVVMAAGLGSRFGGNKQVSVIDDDGNFIIDYSVYDAIRSGFKKVIFIIREEDKQVFEESIDKRLKNHIDVEYAFQKIDDIPCNKSFNRIKPWGTSHAIYSMRDKKCDKFLIINADDFYGFTSFKKAYEFLQNLKDNSHYACISYLVKNTLNDDKAVKRGVLQLENNKIKNIIESKISYKDGALLAEPLSGDESFLLSDTQPVSMNMFACTSDLITLLENDIKDFFTHDEDYILNNEILLPTSLCKYIQAGRICVDNIPTFEEWIGMTYREDLDVVKQKIELKRKNGEYPLHLWN